MEPLPEKIEPIKNLASARNVNKAHQVLGLLGYYRSFIPAFADITLPITSLLKKNTPFVWSDKCQLALEYLKEIFCNKHCYDFQTPISHTYFIWMPLIMHILASFANWLITTKILGQLHILQAPSQHKTGVGVQQKKEAYAVWQSMQHFNYYLQGTKCTLHCDHKPLEPFLTRGMKVAKLDRWAMLLQEYDITFVHIRGKDNILTDAISSLCTIDIYQKAIETQLLPTTQITTTQLDETVEQIQHIGSSPLLQLLNMNSTTLCTLQKQDKFCKNKV